VEVGLLSRTRLNLGVLCDWVIFIVFFCFFGDSKIIVTTKMDTALCEEAWWRVLWTLNLAVHGVGLWKNIRRGERWVQG